MGASEGGSKSDTLLSYWPKWGEVRTDGRGTCVKHCCFVLAWWSGAAGRRCVVSCVCGEADCVELFLCCHLGTDVWRVTPGLNSLCLRPWSCYCPRMCVCVVSLNDLRFTFQAGNIHWYTHTPPSSLWPIFVYWSEFCINACQPLIITWQCSP